MAILTADQRQEILDKVALLEVTLATYSSAAFQTSLTQNVTDAQNVDDGIKALYDKIDTNIIRAYERERTALAGQPVLRNISDFYTGESDEIQALGELSDNYIENIITPIIIAISENNMDTPPDNVQIDPDNDIFRGSPPVIDAIPSNARRMFPQSGTDIRRITQFNIGANREDTRVAPSLWTSMAINMDINNTEEFFLFYQNRIVTWANGGRPANTASFIRSGAGVSVGTSTDVIRNYTLTATAPTIPMMGSAQNQAVAAVGQQFLSDEGDRIEVLVGGTATTSVGDNTFTDTANIVCGVLNAAQTAKVIASQIGLLGIEKTQLELNQDQFANTNSSALTEVNSRLALLGGGTGTDRATRVSEVTSRIATIAGKIGSTGSLGTNYNMRYEFANQRANFANGTIGSISSAIATRDTFLLPNGTEILSLQEEIQALNDSITFSDGFTS